MKRINCKRRLRQRMREFHSPLLFSSTTSLPKISRILNYFKTTPKLPLSSHNLHALTSCKCDKTISNFLVRSALKTNHQPGTFQCVGARCKTCRFFLNPGMISELNEPLRSRTSLLAYLHLCITCTFCKKLYIRETGRRLGDRFR